MHRIRCDHRRSSGSSHNLSNRVALIESDSRHGVYARARSAGSPLGRAVEVTTSGLARCYSIAQKRRCELSTWQNRRRRWMRRIRCWCGAGRCVVRGFGVQLVALCVHLDTCAVLLTERHMPQVAGSARPCLVGVIASALADGDGPLGLGLGLRWKSARLCSTSCRDGLPVTFRVRVSLIVTHVRPGSRDGGKMWYFNTRLTLHAECNRAEWWICCES